MTTMTEPTKNECVDCRCTSFERPLHYVSGHFVLLCDPCLNVRDGHISGGATANAELRKRIVDRVAVMRNMAVRAARAGDVDSCNLWTERIKGMEEALAFIDQADPRLDRTEGDKP